MSGIIKLSSPATREYWEIPVLFEDEQLLALDKPCRLRTSPDRFDPERPNLMGLLHRDIARGAVWSRDRQITYLANTHRLDSETTGVILLAKTKPALVFLANQFGSERPVKTYLALAQGSPTEDAFSIELKLAPHPTRLGLMRVDQKTGKKAKTDFEVLERFSGYTLFQCRPATGQNHQIRVHLHAAHYPLVGDPLYGGRPLQLSRLKPKYRLKPKAIERPLIERACLHAAELSIAHPTKSTTIQIRAPWPKDLTVAMKYLRRYAGGLPPTAPIASEPDPPPEPGA